MPWLAIWYWTAMTMLQAILTIPAIFTGHAGAPISDAPAQSAAPAAPQPTRTRGAPRIREGSNRYDLYCESNKCSIGTSEFSLDVEKTGTGIAIRPRTFTNDPHGILMRYGSKVEITQLKFVPEKLFPSGGHYLVGPGDEIIEWISGRSDVAKISAPQFISRIRRYPYLYVIASQRMGHDTITSEIVKIGTADFVRIIERAQGRLK